MKKKFRVLGGLALLVVPLLILAAVITSVAATAGTSGIIMAEGVVGTVTTDKVDAAAPELNMNSVLDEIVKISISRTPLTVLTDKLSKRAKSTAWEQQGYELVERPYEDTVAATYTTQTGVKSAEITVTNKDLWTRDHTMLVQLGSDPTAYPMLLITSFNYGTSKVTVETIDPDGKGTSQPDLPTIAAGTKITRLGAALSELQANMSSFAEMPSKQSNYNQRFGTKVAVSFFQELAKQEVKWGFSDIRALRLKKMREEEEMSAWFGKKGITVRTNANGEAEPVYTMDGLIRSAGMKRGEYGTGGSDRTFDSKALNKICESAFAGNNGSSVRYAFHGSKVGTYLADGITNWTKMVQDSTTEIISGLYFSTFKSTYGELRFIYHPLFDKAGLSECMVIVDFDNLVYAEYKPLETIELKLKEAGISNEKAVFIDHAFTILPLYDECHMFVKPKA